MEALLEKEGKVESWNDERLDELSRRVDAGFEKAATKVELTAVKDEMNLRFTEVDKRFDQVDKRFGRVEGQLDRINHRLDYMLGGMFLASLGLLANLLADKL
jgi:tetrahydromethanopterin S-methyltransferase subunit G